MLKIPLRQKRNDAPVSTLRDLCSAWGLLDPKKHYKYTELEMAQMLDMLLRQQEGLLEKARRIYKEQRSELERLKSPELWRFGTRTQAPPDYKAEYMRRIRGKGLDRKE